MQPVALVILLSLLQYWVFTVLVARYRPKTQGAYPSEHADTLLAQKSSGSSTFVPSPRELLNPVESLVVFVPAVWFFGIFVDPGWATVLGGAFLIGRVTYAVGCLASTGSKPSLALGTVLSSLAELALLMGAIGGLCVHWNLLS